MRKIIFSNRKGGCAKTTITINLAALLAKSGKKVLVIDLDSQAHSTFYLNVNPYSKEKNLYSLFKNEFKNLEMDSSYYIVKTEYENLYLLPSSAFIDEIDFNNTRIGGTVLYKLFQNNNDFDFILIDTSPNVNLLTINGFVLSNEVMIPIQMHPLSIKGLAQLIRVIYKINKLYNKNIVMSGIIPAMYNKRTKVYAEVLEKIKKTFPEHIIMPGIRFDIRLAEAPDYQMPIIYYAPSSRASQDFVRLAERILKQ